MARITDQIDQAYRKNVELDLVRAEFLKDLDDADHINVTDWESEFIETNISRTSFSEKQRAAIDHMREKYQDRL
jgi:hypothetical protein